MNNPSFDIEVWRLVVHATKYEPSRYDIASMEKCWSDLWEIKLFFAILFPFNKKIMSLLFHFISEDDFLLTGWTIWNSIFSCTYLLRVVFLAHSLKYIQYVIFIRFKIILNFHVRTIMHHEDHFSKWHKFFSFLMHYITFVSINSHDTKMHAQELLLFHTDDLSWCTIPFHIKCILIRCPEAIRRCDLSKYHVIEMN